MYNYGGFYANDTRAKLKHLSGGEYGHTETHIKLCGITATVEEYQDGQKVKAERITQTGRENHQALAWIRH